MVTVQTRYGFLVIGSAVLNVVVLLANDMHNAYSYMPA